MKGTSVTPELYQYMLDISLREHPVLTELRDKTAHLPLAHMQISPDQAQFMQFLIRLIGAKSILELGTYTGYSALAMALALPTDGRLITCDINNANASKAPAFWEKANQEKKIQLRIQPGLNCLKELIEEGYQHSFDFIFIDADKTNYLNYYELSLSLLSPKGILAIDNIFWNGKVIDREDSRSQTRCIRELNQLIKQDQRIDLSLLTIADGLFLIRRANNSFV